MMMRHSLWSALAVIFLTAVSPNLALALTCQDLFSPRTHVQSQFIESVNALYSQETTERIQSELRPEIERSLKDVSELSPENVKMVFSAYMKSRLADLPSKVQQGIHKTIDDGIDSSSFTPSLWKKELSGSAGKTPAGSFKLKLSMPDFLFETIIDYTVKIHELEHLIQFQTTGVGQATLMYLPRFVSHRHAVEMGAIRSEGTFLSLFPKRLLAVEKERLENLSRSGRTSQLALAMVRNSVNSKNVDEYLQMTTQQGRYSVSQLRTRQFLSYAIFPGSTIPILYLGHIFGW